MNTAPPRWIILPFVVLVSVTAGCGKTYTVKGKVTVAGEPIQWKSDNRYMLVIFGPMDRKAYPDVFRAECDIESGTYVVKAPASEYVIAVQLFDPLPTVDQLNHQYDLGRSPLRYEISGNADFDIDVPRIMGRAPAPEDKLKK